MLDKTQITTIPLSAIVVNGSNPRKRLNDETVQELSVSIANNGLINAIVVRPTGKDKYEIIAGHRRHAAVKLLEWDVIDCRVITPENDAEAALLATMDNIQREDLNPLEEAESFSKLLENYTIEQLADKLGRKVKYIKKRIGLSNLEPIIKRLLIDDKIPIRCAVELSRLSKSDQMNILNTASNYVPKLNGEELAYQKKEVYRWGWTDNRLREYVQQHIEHNLNAYRFKKDDPELNPVAGPCTTCPKRSGANAELFDDIKSSDTCFNPACLSIKMGAFLKIAAAPLIAAGKPYLLRSSEYGVSDITRAMLKTVKLDTENVVTKYNHEWIEAGKDDDEDQIVEALWIDGPKVGKICKMVVAKKTGSSKKSGTSEDLPAPARIENIKQNLERGYELNRNKEYQELKGLMSEHAQFGYDEKTKFDVLPLSDVERGFMAMYLFNKLDWTTRTIVESKILGKKDDWKAADWIKLANDNSLMDLMHRSIYFHEYCNKNVERDAELHAMMFAAADSVGVKTADLRQKYKELNSKKADRATERINKVKSEGKEKKKADVKKPADGGTKKVASGAKKVASGAKKPVAKKAAKKK